MGSFRRALSALLLFSTGVLLASCRTAHQVRDGEYAQLNDAVQVSWSEPAAAVDPVATQVAGTHSVDEYIQFALRQNPEIQAARKRMESLAFQVPAAASLQDPTLTATAQPEPIQTAAGQQELILSASQKLPWFGKLGTRASMAESETNVARAQLAAVELATIEKVKKAYYELYFIQQAIRVTEADRQLLTKIRAAADKRYVAGLTSQQDLLRADLELLNVENSLIGLRQQFESGQARLARILHVSPETDLRTQDTLQASGVPADLERLQELAMAANPELHAQLFAIQREQQAVELAHLDYRPDVTMGVSWIDVADAGVSPVTNGRDAFLLSAGINVPIYQKRLDAEVRSAEAKAVSAARQYDSLRDGTLEAITDLFVKIKSQQDLLVLLRDDILPRASQTLEVSNAAYSVGQVDFLQLIDNWRGLLRYQISYYRLEASLQQTLAELERVVGGYSEALPGASASDLPAPNQESEAIPREENGD